MEPKTKAAAAFISGIVGLLAVYIDLWFFAALLVGICGVVNGVSALKSDAGTSEKGIAAAGTLASALALCVAVGSLLGFIAVLAGA